MLLRAAIVFLVLLNLGAAGWWALGPKASVRPVTLLQGPPLQLVAEARATRARSSAPAKVAGTCLRLGPFAGPAARSGAEKSLVALGVEAVPFEDRSGAASGWDVYLPAQASRAEAMALADRLRAAGVDDLFVMNDGRNANRIALGRFSSEAGARRRADEVRAKGAEAIIEARGNGAPRIWLNVRLPAGMDADRVTSIAAAKPQDCRQMP